MAQCIVDLSHPIYNGSPCYPGDPQTSIAHHCTLARDSFRVNRITFGTHQGTHVDAPSHFLENGATIDALPLEAFHGPATLLRIQKDEDELVTETDLAKFDKQLVTGARIIIETGWSSHFSKPEYFANPPVLTPDAVRLLAMRKLALFGIDGPDIARDEKSAHELLLGAGIVLLENLANLDQCPESFTLSAFPLKLEKCDGSPVRAVAICETNLGIIETSGASNLS